LEHRKPHRLILRLAFPRGESHEFPRVTPAWPRSADAPAGETPTPEAWSCRHGQPWHFVRPHVSRISSIFPCSTRYAWSAPVKPATPTRCRPSPVRELIVPRVQDQRPAPEAGQLPPELEPGLDLRTTAQNHTTGQRILATADRQQL